MLKNILKKCTLWTNDWAKAGSEWGPSENWPLEKFSEGHMFGPAFGTNIFYHDFYLCWYLSEESWPVWSHQEMARDAVRGEMFWEHLMTMMLLNVRSDKKRIIFDADLVWDAEENTCCVCRNWCPLRVTLYCKAEKTVINLSEPTTSADINQTLIALAAPQNDNGHSHGVQWEWAKTYLNTIMSQWLDVSCRTKEISA